MVEIYKFYNTKFETASDNTTDLGESTIRWKNLYLSGSLNVPAIVGTSIVVGSASVASLVSTAAVITNTASIGYLYSTSGIRLNPAPSPTGVEGNIWNDRVQRTFSVYVNSLKQTIVGTVYSTTTNQIITNTTAATSVFSTSSVGTLMFPPSFMAPGKLIRISGAGVYSAPITPGSASIVLTLGGSTLASLATSSFLGNAASAGFAFESKILCQTSGSTGKFSTVGNVNYQGVLGLNTIRVFDDLDADGTATTINSTTHLLVGLNLAWDTIDSGKTVNIVYSSVEVLN